MVPNGWEVKQLADLTTKISDGIHSTPQYAENSDIHFINGNNLKNGSIVISSATKKVCAEDAQNHVRDLSDRTILMSINGTIGNLAFYNNENVVLGKSACYLNVNHDVDIKYIYYTLNSSKTQNFYTTELTGSTIKNLSLKTIKSTKILTPPLLEQQKIAKILSTWDKAISTTERLIENSTQQKKALMQQLLTGKQRFGFKENSYEFQSTRYGDIPRDWEYSAIKDVSIQLSKKNTDGKDYPVVSCSKHYGFVDSLDYFKKKVYSDDTSGYRIIPRNAFGFPSNHIEEGSIGLQTVHDIAIASPIYVVFKADPKLINNIYLYALLKTEHYRQIFCAATNASVDRRGSLRWKEFSAIRIPLPPLEEQNKIATVLTTADKEIELLEQQLADLQQEKKALMQVLLTGKKRVLVEE